MRRLINYLLIWQAAIILITVFSIPFLPLRPTFVGGQDQASVANPKPYLRNPLLFSRANFDGIHYVEIARRGYDFGQQGFFPLYPRILHLVSRVIHPPALAGSIVSLISFSVGLVFFYKLLKKDFSEKTSQLAILVLLFFPTSFFFSFVYTEGLFFLLVIASFYYARSGKWLPAIILGAVAAYTRFVGVFLFPAFVVEMWQQTPRELRTARRFISKSLPLLLIPLGLALFMQFLHRTTGDPFAFFHIQKTFAQGRSDKIILLYQVYWRYIKMVFTVNRADPLYLTICLEFLTGVLFLFTSIYSIYRHRLSYAVFNFTAFLTPTFTGTFTSLPRYVLVCFSSIIAIAEILSRLSVPKKTIYFTASAVLFVLYLALFVRGYWVS
ncbi:MAG: hypothetical protein UX87_C0046G0004 [Candidatus Amesbacteria bacterium GW2011_GWA1_47_16]|uniref:Uncharacterized protein n=2 Tax=Candidatus Amesiibacteriota TaxID=1752730 RepID=A0A1F4Z0D8_9BACT|nr:MAG: hypothetical protein UX87_C0046G0004 [Candidatus Amesbacteria bacterium GW2011_GWA1_47_16]OGC99680.1 MAG: hypothetical protein A2972_04695 [Candidatus Amesbacteria bacterium RIFCSPLOWO2_01_FULL_47_33]